MTLARAWLVTLAAALIGCAANTSGLGEDTPFDGTPGSDSAAELETSADSAPEVTPDTSIPDTEPSVDSTPEDSADVAEPADAGCPTNAVKCAGECIDIKADPDRCGACSMMMACAAGSMCLNGACACQPGLTRCGACVDTKGDPDHCGACDAKCGKDRRCVDGKCEMEMSSKCPSSRPDECAASGDNRKGCYNTKRDPMHCGGCETDKRCDSDQVCADGACVDYEVGLGCTTCPCTVCETVLPGSTCCPAPPGSAPNRVFCVDAAACPSYLP